MPEQRFPGDARSPGEAGKPTVPTAVKNPRETGSSCHRAQAPGPAAPPCCDTGKYRETNPALGTRAGRLAAVGGLKMKSFR